MYIGIQELVYKHIFLLRLEYKNKNKKTNKKILMVILSWTQWLQRGSLYSQYRKLPILIKFLDLVKIGITMQLTSLFSWKYEQVTQMRQIGFIVYLHCPKKSKTVILIIYFPLLCYKSVAFTKSLLSWVYVTLLRSGLWWFSFQSIMHGLTFGSCGLSLNTSILNDRYKLRSHYSKLKPCMI